MKPLLKCKKPSEFGSIVSVCYNSWPFSQPMGFVHTRSYYNSLSVRLYVSYVKAVGLGGSPVKEVGRRHKGDC